MAKGIDTETGEIIAGIPDDMEWTLVHDEAPDQLKLEEIGEEHTLLYMGQAEITPPPTPKQIEKGEEPTPFTQLQFRQRTGVPLVHNAGYEMREAFSDVKPLTWVKVKYVKNVDIGQASPMKSVKVWQGMTLNADPFAE